MDNTLKKIKHTRISMNKRNSNNNKNNNTKPAIDSRQVLSFIFPAN